jgi:hypothetical protein
MSSYYNVSLVKVEMGTQKMRVIAAYNIDKKIDEKKQPPIQAWSFMFYGSRDGRDIF